MAKRTNKDLLTVCEVNTKCTYDGSSKLSEIMQYDVSTYYVILVTQAHAQYIPHVPLIM